MKRKVWTSVRSAVAGGIAGTMTANGIRLFCETKKDVLTALLICAVCLGLSIWAFWKIFVWALGAAYAMTEEERDSLIGKVSRATTELGAIVGGVASVALVGIIYGGGIK